jgi:hypothetical protein
MATAAALATRVLERLRVTAAGETPSAEDSATVTSFYSGIFAEETVNDLFFWDEDDIPDEAFEALADFIAGKISSDFGDQRDDLEASGRMRLRKLSSKASTGLVVTGSYF